MQEVRRSPVMSQFLHVTGLRVCFGTSPLFGQVIFLWPGSLHILQNLICLLNPSYDIFSLLDQGRQHHASCS